MTLEQLLDCNADELEKLTDSQLNEFFSPFYNVTRPELAPKPNKGFEPSPVDFATRQKVVQLQALGIDVSMILQQRKKR